MSAESLAGLYKILVDDPQSTESHVIRVVIIPERKGVIGVEPPEIEMAPFLGGSDGDHDYFSVKRIFLVLILPESLGL
jgi:hypothetical protein